MKKIYTLFIVVITVLTTQAQTTVEFDMQSVLDHYKKEFDGTTVIDAYAARSKTSTAYVKMDNPFKDQDFLNAEIAFDVYNYDAVTVTGALFCIYDETLGRVFFSNASSLYYSDHFANNPAEEHHFNANSKTGGWGIDQDFLQTEVWKNVKVKFTNEGYSVTIDDELAFDQNSTDVTIGGNMTDYSELVTLLKNATTFMIGTGSLWMDDQSSVFYNSQNSYLKNITFTYSSIPASTVDLTKNAKVVGTEFYNTNGAYVGAVKNELAKGLYIKRVSYDNGQVLSSKVQIMF